MHFRCSDRTLFKIYIVAVTVLFILYIIPVILFYFLGMDVTGISDGLRELGQTVYRIFFLVGVPIVSLILGALSITVLSEVPDKETRMLPRYIGYLMLFVTLLSIIIWITDMSVYQSV